MWDFLKELTNPESIIRYGGLALLFIVVFAETGLLIGFFLPGDSLIFISGLFCRTKPELIGINIYFMISGLITAAVIGNMVAYWFGKKVGPPLFRRNDSLIFKKRYLEATRDFYEKHGGKTLVLGRFLPIIRTFAPILAGVIRVDFGKFMLYNIAGAAAWIGTLCTAGYLLGQVRWVSDNVEYIVVGLIVITLIPLLPFLRRKKT
jgi:membrane-associated protein